jgi:hypothetical protein
MTSIVARVTSTSTETSLTRLRTAPLGLDVCEITPQHAVLQVEEAEAGRLESMGYAVEQLQSPRPTCRGSQPMPRRPRTTRPAAWMRTCGSSLSGTLGSPSSTRSGAAWRAGPCGHCGSGSVGAAVAR